MAVVGDRWWHDPVLRVFAAVLGLALLAGTWFAVSAFGVPSDVEQDARNGAESYCFYSTNGEQYSEEYANCVDMETEQRIEEWEAAN